MKHQQGATLIMVLVVLLLISIIATIAMRESLFGLRLSTNNQVDNLLLENSDSALFSVEDPSKVSDRLATNSMYGHFLYPANANDVLVFCYDASKPEFFKISRASVLGNDSKLGKRGYCTKNTFASGRNAIISQVYIQKVATSDSAPLAGLSEGTSIGQGQIGIPAMRVSATAISILPSFIKDVDAAVKCFNEKDTINETTTCLREQNAPYNLQYAEYMIRSDFDNTRILKNSTS